MSPNNQELKRKGVEVASWLSQIFGNEQIPDFEKNSQTIELLHQLFTICHWNESNAQLYLEDLKRKSEEYDTDALRVGAIMGRLTLGEHSLSSTASAHNQALAQTGALLCVKNASDASFMLSLRELKSDLNEVADKLQVECKDIQKLSKKTQAILIKHNSLDKALEEVEKRSVREVAQLKKEKKETEMLKKTTEADEHKISKLKTELAKTGLSQSYFHDNLVKKKEKLDGIQDELVPLKDKLESYATLPPNAVEAKVKIEQLKMELAELKAQMSECVGVTGI